MFARRLNVRLSEGEQLLPVPKDWLDRFFMRNFTGHAAFDETLAVGDGELETGFAVSPGLVREQFEQWLRGRRMIAAGVRLVVEVEGR